ncbi:DUF2911 domain-containing protein [Formosa sediminum]|uniref:DUF2911 domain-containing protein n=1 Tax=Formosa sediminum TaxID=2594004 RepID=A0A516GQU9_9FLAO|nr:DUF2911 domain-containing protein [Formosa sediminum]QDO93902.1 DUF2911 domain-containing protein [Formosa sediminum]
MKRILLIVAIVLAGTTVNAQEFNKIDKSPMDRAYYPPGVAHDRIFEKDPVKKKALIPQIRVTYSRPAKRGRVVFGELLKYGQPWRVGANESTEILFMNDVVFAGKKIKAGRYTMIIIPTEKEWTLKLNTALDGWGNYGYDASLDIASLSVPVTYSDTEIENLSIVLYEASPKTVHLKIGWDKTIAEFPITLK